MILYTCGHKTSFASVGHPCGRAANALDEAGYTYEIKTVKGYKLAFWTWPSRSKDREEVRRLSGTNKVPILVLDDGNVISGSGTIAKWAKEHPRQQTEVGGG